MQLLCLFKKNRFTLNTIHLDNTFLALPAFLHYYRNINIFFYNFALPPDQKVSVTAYKVLSRLSFELIQVGIDCQNQGLSVIFVVYH